jgi:hypothetical protein
MAEGIADWSNAKRARVFAHIIAKLVLERGGEVRVKLDELARHPVGFDVEDGELIIAVDMDDVQTSAPEVMSIDRNGAEAVAVDRRRRHLMDNPDDLKSEDVRFARYVLRLSKKTLEG